MAHTPLTASRRAALEWAAEALRLNRCDVLREPRFREAITQTLPRRRPAPDDIVGCALHSLHAWLRGASLRPMLRTQWEITAACAGGTYADVDNLAAAHHAEWLRSGKIATEG